MPETYFGYLGHLDNCTLPWHRSPGVSRGIGGVSITEKYYSGGHLYVIARSPGHPDICSEPALYWWHLPDDGQHVTEVPVYFWTYAVSPVPLKGGTTANLHVFYKLGPGAEDTVQGVRCVEDDNIKVVQWDTPGWLKCTSPCLFTNIPLKSNVTCRLLVQDLMGSLWALDEPILNINLDF